MSTDKDNQSKEAASSDANKTVSELSDEALSEVSGGYVSPSLIERAKVRNQTTGYSSSKKKQ